MALDLVNITDAHQVVAAISQQLSISPPINQAIASTVLTLGEIQRTFGRDGSLSLFLPHRLLLLPPHAQSAQPPPDSIAQYFCELALLANSAAESLGCSSILAGEGSESDDTGDVAFWLGNGDYGPGKELDVLQVFELTRWLDQGAEVSPVALSSSYQFTLPSTLSGGTPSSAVDDLMKKINEMTDKHCFRVRSSATAPLVVFFLLGRFMESWGGLVGIGTWSDLD